MIRLMIRFCSIPTDFRQGKVFIKKPTVLQSKSPQICRSPRIYEFFQVYKMKRNLYKPNDYGEIAEEILFHMHLNQYIEAQQYKDFDQIIRDVTKMDPKQLSFDNFVKLFSLYRAMQHYENRPREGFKLLYDYLEGMLDDQIKKIDSESSLTHLVQLYNCSCAIETESQQLLQSILRVLRRKIQPKTETSNETSNEKLKKPKIISKKKSTPQSLKQIPDQPQDYFTQILNQQDEISQEISDFKCQSILSEISPLFASLSSKSKLNQLQIRIIDLCFNWMQSIHNIDLFSQQVLTQILLMSNRLSLIHYTSFIEQITNHFLLKSNKLKYSLMLSFLRQNCYMSNNFMKIYSTLYSNLMSRMSSIDDLHINRQEVKLKMAALLLKKVSPSSVLPEHVNTLEECIWRYVSTKKSSELYAELVRLGVFDQKIESETCLVSRRKIQLTWNILFQCLVRSRSYNIQILKAFLAEKGETMSRPIHLRSYIISRLHKLHPTLVADLYSMEIRQWERISDDTTKEIARNGSAERIMNKWQQQFGHLYIPKLLRLKEKISKTKESRSLVFIDVHMFRSIDQEKDSNFFPIFNEMPANHLMNLLQLELLRLKCARSSISPVYLKVILMKLEEHKLKREEELASVILYLKYTLKDCNPKLPEKTLQLYFKTVIEVVVISHAHPKNKQSIIDLIKACLSLQEWLETTSHFKTFLLRLQSQLKFFTNIPHLITLFHNTALSAAVVLPLDSTQGKSLSLLSCGNDVRSAETLIINPQNVSVCFYTAQRATELVAKLNQLQAMYQSFPKKAIPSLIAHFNYQKNADSCFLFQQLSTLLSACPVQKIDLLSVIPKITLFRNRDSEHEKVFLERVISHCKSRISQITLAAHLEVLIACRFFSCQDETYFKALINRIVDGSCCDEKQVFRICEALCYLDYSFSQRELKNIFDRYSWGTSQQAIMVIILQDSIITPTLCLSYLTKMLQRQKDKLHISKIFLGYITYIYPSIAHKLISSNSFEVSLLKDKRVNKVLNAITGKTGRTLQLKEQPFSHIQDSKDNILIFPVNSSRCLLRFLNKLLRLQTSKMQQAIALIASCDPISSEMKILSQINLNHPQLIGDHYENIQQELIQQGQFTK